MEKMMMVSKPSDNFEQNSLEEDTVPFAKSLQELKDLRSQLRYAADYCETSFLNATEKRIVVENTKEYICKAVVAMVDHIGCVSNKLNCSISKANAFSDAELRIHCLKQKLLSCGEYAHRLALTRVRWNPISPHFHRRYISASNMSVTVAKSNEDKRESNDGATSTLMVDENRFSVEDLPLFFYTYAQKSSSAAKTSPFANISADLNSSLVLPVQDGTSILSKGPNATFHFQQSSEKRGRNLLLRKSAHGSIDKISTLIRRTKRTTS